MQAVLLLAQGRLWSRLEIGLAAARIAFWCSICGTLSIRAAYAIAAFCGVRLDLMGELPHSLTRGSGAQEIFSKVLAYSSAPTGLTAFVFMLWGLRIGRSREMI